MPLDPRARDHYDASARAAAERLARGGPVPAVCGRIRTGTASWTDPTLVRSGLFYPPTARTSELRLRHYATRFALVEVDASYYALPTAAAAAAWAERTPPDFQFHIKAFASITGHPVEVARLPRDLELPAGCQGRRRVEASALPASLRKALDARFVEALRPLQEAGRLASVLLQLPPWCVASRASTRWLAGLRQRFPDLPLAVEFRHASWIDPARRARVFDLLRDLAMAYVAVDTPRCGDTALPPLPEVTWPPLAVVRFHGRNAATWAGADSAAARFDHLYTEDELRSWVRPLRRLAEEAGAVHALFNNCTYDAGVLGAQGLAALLDGGGAG